MQLTIINEATFKTLQDKAKQELQGIIFSMRYHGKSGAKYAKGTFDIQPTKRNPGKLWSADEAIIVVDWLRKNGFFIKEFGQNESYVYRKGMTYINKVVQ